MHTDPISDLLIRIQNAARARKQSLTMPHSKMKEAILEVLKRRHYVASFKTVKEGSFNVLEVALKPELREIHLERVSKPGQRIYIKAAEIKSVLNGYGISVYSTSKGVMAGDEARKQGLGGEYLCNIW